MKTKLLHGNGQRLSAIVFAKVDGKRGLALIDLEAREKSPQNA